MKPLFSINKGATGVILRVAEVASTNNAVKLGNSSRLTKLRNPKNSLSM
jgi:hypothetical protein